MPLAASLPYPADLTEQEWALLAPWLPPPTPGGRPRAVDLRRIGTGLFHVLRSGCQWRLTPRDDGPWSTLYASWGRWRLEGTWEQIHPTRRAR